LREQIMRPGLWNDPGVRREALDAAQRTLAGDTMSSEERMLIIDTLVTIAVVSRDPRFYPHLDDWSREAAELMPATNTRAVVLVELGKSAAGKTLLDARAKPGFATTDPFDMCERIMTQAFIARAEGALGDPAPARRRLAAARDAIGANAAYEVLRPVVD